jgi:hypothetical protein
MLFEISEYSENAKGCDVAGPSILGELQGDRFLYVYEAKVFGAGLTAVASCKSADACRATSKAWREEQRTPPTNVTLSFLETVDEGHRQGISRFTGFAGASGPCTEAHDGTTKLELRGDTLSMELRAAVGDVPRDERGMCSTAAAVKGLAGKPCTLHRVLRAKAVGPL